MASWLHALFQLLLHGFRTQDERGLRKLAARAFGTGMTRATDKAVSLLNSLAFPTEEVLDALRQQSAIEQGRPTLTEAAAPTTQAYGMIFGHLGTILNQPEQPLKTLGQQIGSLLYWRDAFDDLAADTQAGKFNPLTYTPLTELRQQSKLTLAQLTHTQSVLPLQHNQELLGQVCSATIKKHSDMTEEEEDSAQKKKWYDHCDCCDCCGCIDASQIADCFNCTASAGKCGGGKSNDGCCDCDCCDC